MHSYIFYSLTSGDLVPLVSALEYPGFTPGRHPCFSHEQEHASAWASWMDITQTTYRRVQGTFLPLEVDSVLV